MTNDDEQRQQVSQGQRGDAKSSYGLDAILKLHERRPASERDTLEMAHRPIPSANVASHNSRSAEQDRPGENSQAPIARTAQADEVPAVRPVKRVERRLTVIQPSKTLYPRFKGQVMPPLPTMATRQGYGMYIGFLVCVVLPIIAASIYFGFIASNQYVTEFRFTVKDTSTTPNPAAGGVMALLSMGSGSGGGAMNDNYIVADYLTSRQVVEELQKRIDIRRLYSKPTADWWSRFDASQPIEKLVDYWQGVASARYDMVTGIAIAQVRAFSAQDAYLIVSTMMKLSEELINQMSNRSEKDAVRFAEVEVNRAEDRLKRIRAQLTAYRDKVGVIDPATSVVASNSTLTLNLRSNLAQLETQLATLTKANLLPTAPAVVSLKNQIKATKEQLAATEFTVGNRALERKDGSLSKVVGEYEQLDMERTFAQTMVTSAMAALDQARSNASTQHLYITPYVSPSLPESSIYPRRVFSVVMVGVFAFALWVMGIMVVRSIRERFA